jgi:hypothetical protein
MKWRSKGPASRCGRRIRASYEDFASPRGDNRQIVSYRRKLSGRIVAGTWNSRVDSTILPTKTASSIIAHVGSRRWIIRPIALGAVTVVRSPGEGV